MSDDPTPQPDDRYLLAVSAVLDGTAGPDERALVDADPALQQLVRDYPAVRDELAVVVPDTARVSAIDAALASFDALHGSGPGLDAEPVAASPPVAPVVELASRRRGWNPRVLLGAAAALVAVVAIGGAIVTSNDSSDDLSSAKRDTAATAPVDAIESAASATTSASPFAASDSAAPVAAPSAQTGAAEANVPTAGGQNQTAASTADTTSATDGATAGTIGDTAGGGVNSTAPVQTIGNIPGAGDVVPRLLDTDSLIAFADRAAAGGGTGTSVPLPDEPACRAIDGYAIGPVAYGVDSIPAVVVRNPVSNELTVYADDDCRILTSVVP